MDDIMRCSKCKLDCLKSNFQKNTKTSDGSHPQCKISRKKYYNENLVKIKKYYSDNRDGKKEYYLKNRDKISIRHNEYIENRLKTDINFRLIHSTRRRMHHVLNGKSKSSSTKDISGIDIDLHRKWIEGQLTPEMNWTNIELDHVKPICMFDISDNEQLKEAFNWRNIPPSLKKVINKRVQNLISYFIDYSPSGLTNFLS